MVEIGPLGVWCEFNIVGLCMDTNIHADKSGAQYHSCGELIFFLAVHEIVGTPDGIP